MCDDRTPRSRSHCGHGYCDKHGNGASGAAGPDWKRALGVRSEAINKQYGLGDYAPSWRHALEVRSETLNRGPDN